MVTLQNNPSTIATPADKAIGTYHLASEPNLYEIQRSNNFEFLVTGLDGIRLAGTVSKDSVVSNAQEIIRLSVSSAPIPHFEQSVISIRRGNNELKYAGVPTFNSGQITVNDYIGADTKSVLMAWQNLSYNVETEKVGLMQDYKKDCYLLEYSPDYQLVRSWKLYGCWISSITENNYSSDDNNKHQISATIQYDRAMIDMSDIPE